MSIHIHKIVCDAIIVNRSPSVNLREIPLQVRLSTTFYTLWLVFSSSWIEKKSFWRGTAPSPVSQFSYDRTLWPLWGWRWTFRCHGHMHTRANGEARITASLGKKKLIILTHPSQADLALARCNELSSMVTLGAIILQDFFHGIPNAWISKKLCMATAFPIILCQLDNVWQQHS